MQTNYELSSQSPQSPPQQSLSKQPNLSGQSEGVFQAWKLILHVVFGAVDEPLASCVVVQFQIYVSER